MERTLEEPQRATFVMDAEPAAEHSSPDRPGEATLPLEALLQALCCQRAATFEKQFQVSQEELPRTQTGKKKERREEGREGGWEKGA